jgi:hypothetical protein
MEQKTAVWAIEAKGYRAVATLAGVRPSEQSRGLLRHKHLRIGAAVAGEDGAAGSLRTELSVARPSRARAVFIPPTNYAAGKILHGPWAPAGSCFP